MYPRLFTIGPFTVYSFGLMLAIGFIVASAVLTKELNRKGIDASVGSTVTLMAVVFGIIGCKLLFLVESWKSFVAAPFEMAFSPAGMTWYGGFVLATAAIWLYARRKKFSFLKICDAAAPALMLGYGIARIGCHLAGDGDYGMPTTLPWGAVYSKGIVPPSLAFSEFPEVVQKYGVNGVVPDTIAVHPAPLYETLMAVALFLVLWKMRARSGQDGMVFMKYLILAGSARFLVEFIRLNPRLLFGLSEAQLISLFIIVIGIIGARSLLKNQRPVAVKS